MRWTIFAALIAAPLITSCAPAPAPKPWTQFRQNASHNAVISGELQARWRLMTDGRISASPSFYRDTIFLGTNAGTFYAINAKDGRVLWKRHVGNALMSGPLIVHGLVIAGEGNSGTPHPQGGKPVHVGTGASAIVAFDRQTGEIRWRTRLHGSGMPTPAIVAGVLVHHDGSGRVTGMDPLSGRLLYERSVHSVASMSAAVPIDETHAVTSGALHNAVLNIDARTGMVRWRADPFPKNATGIGDCPAATDAKRVFGEYVVPVSRASADIGDDVREHAYALDARTGALLWDTPLEMGPLPIDNEAGIPVVYGGAVYVGGAAAPWMNALDAKTGRVLWRTQVYGPIKGAPVIKHNVLYAGDLGGYLWALNAKTGAKIGVKSMPTSFNVGSPIIVGKTLIIGSFTGAVYAVPLQSIREAGR